MLTMLSLDQATTAGANLLTLDTLQRIAEVVQALPADPLEQRMVADGFDPKQGGILLLPKAFSTKEWGPFGPPDYVRFSHLIRVPTYVRVPIHQGLTC